MSATARDGAGGEAMALALPTLRLALGAGLAGLLLGAFAMAALARRWIRELAVLSHLLSAAVPARAASVARGERQ